VPELPEVEVAARSLSRWLRGRALVEVAIAPSRVVRTEAGEPPNPSAREMAARLEGRTVRAVERRGKWLRLALDDGAALYAHLGMTGKWVSRPRGAPAERSERARFDTARASVRYVDQRLFGRLVYAAPGAPPPPAFAELGPDPLADGVDGKLLAARFGGVRRAVKEALLDQTRLAGLGNIQAAEALWRARLDPRLPCASLDGRQWAALARAIRDSIDYTLSVEDKPSEITYVEEPGAPNPFLVYGKEGEPCPRCAQPIARVTQSGRSTFFCRRCQAAGRVTRGGARPSRSGPARR
jgi:formamidopyrimidine-DNA glycosylase